MQMKIIEHISERMKMEGRDVRDNFGKSNLNLLKREFWKQKIRHIVSEENLLIIVDFKNIIDFLF